MKFISILSVFLYLSLFANQTLKEIFTEERQNPLNAISSSLPDSARLQMQSCIEEYGIGSFFDAGCGTSPWIPPSLVYLGVDLVASPAGISKDASFRVMDLTDETVPKHDLIYCRDTLHLFSYCDIAKTLQKFKESKSRYLILSTFPEAENKETSTGIGRKINFEAFPFSFPSPLALFQDASEEGKNLALWRLDDLDFSPFIAYAFPPVTVMTKPIGQNLQWEHWGVAGSARRGLRQVHPNYNFNPNSEREVKENVIVINDARAGVQAYHWKEAKKIRSLMVGPNFEPGDTDFFIAWPLVDAYLSNSDWPALNLYRINQKLENKIRIWYAGVDELQWKPSVKFKDKNSNKVLLYRKTNPEISDRAQRCLEEAGYEVVTIRYGDYSHESFKSALEQCKFAVFVSRSESQGLALAEAWCMDVPTLVWNPKTPFNWAGFDWLIVSSCPYINPMVGSDWNEIVELNALLASMEARDFQPRRWTLLNMTDKVSIEQLLSDIRDNNAGVPPHLMGQSIE